MTARTITASLLVAVFVLAVSACASNISRDVLLRQMQGDQPPLIIDVRSQSEYDRDHLPGAVRIPFYSVGSGVEGLQRSRQEPIVLYCEHGPRSGWASLSLSLSGYEQVYSLDGHMKGWRAAGFPVEVKAQK